MKIATFNANSIRARMPIIISWLEQHQPDILAIQETKVQDQDFPSTDIQSAGYHAVFSGQKSYNGVAILSRKPLTNVQKGFDDGEDSPRIIRGTYDDLTIINTYVPQGRDRDSEHYTYKLDWFQRLRSMFEANFTPNQSVIWLGDLNVAPEPMDVYDPKRIDGHVCFNAELTALFKEVCAWGFLDIFRKHHPEPGQYTFFDYRMRGSLSRNTGWRIDHILGTKPVFEGSQNAYIDLEPRRSDLHKPSDHTFLVAEV